MTTFTKTVRFGDIMVGTTFTSADVGPRTYVKKTPTKAEIFEPSPEESPVVPFNVSRAMMVEVLDHDAKRRHEEEQAKPLYDGSRESCRSDREFYLLYDAHRDVENVMAKLNEAAESVTRRAAQVQLSLRRDAVLTRDIVKISAKTAAAHTGINSLGELQGLAIDFDRLCAILDEKKNAYKLLVRALGYRLE